MLDIKDIYVSCDGTDILKGLSLRIRPGEKHVIMGPNGAGKSTLAKILIGDPHFTVTSGEITFHGQDLLVKDIEERAASGLFVSFQTPPEISGLSGNTLLFEALNQIRIVRKEKTFSKNEFRQRLDEICDRYGFKETETLLDRPFNVGFSGGERKKNEILQMLMLEPILAVLDEPDSGLDVDAMKFVSNGLNRYCQESSEKSLIIITHYPHIASYLSPDYVHILDQGVISLTGGADLIPLIESEGYEKLGVC